MKVIRIFTFLLLTISIYGCHPGENKSFEALTIHKFETGISQSSDKTILDVRTPQEFRQGHLKNVTHIDIYDPAFEQKIKALDKSKPIYVYCASGIRSEKASEVLAENGFREIYHMEGGLNDWINANKPVEK